MKYHIAIPSYKRSSVILEKTLAYLSKTDIPNRSVTVFVTKEELDLYTDCTFKCKKVGRVQSGVPTLKGQRAFIRKHYGKGSYVFSIDDDIEGIYHAPTDKNKDLKLITNLDRLLKEGFSNCERMNISLWGVSAVLNAYFMYGKGISTDLKYICGGAYGEIIDKDKFLDVVLEDKEDFERSIRHFIKRGKVMRFNEYALHTKGYKGVGGMQETRTKERVKEGALWLLKNFPNHCIPNTGKKNQDFAEVKLVKNPRI